MPYRPCVAFQCTLQHATSSSELAEHGPGNNEPPRSFSRWLCLLWQAVLDRRDVHAADVDRYIVSIAPIPLHQTEARRSDSAWGSTGRYQTTTAPPADTPGVECCHRTRNVAAVPGIFPVPTRAVRPSGVVGRGLRSPDVCTRVGGAWFAGCCRDRWARRQLTCPAIQCRSHPWP